MKGQFITRLLRADDAGEFARLLAAQSTAYARFFSPFSFSPADVSRLLADRERDIFMGMYWQERLVGFFMLRGWDEGYEVPAYGVLIDEGHAGCGLATLSLRAAKAICRLCAAPRLMLKVHPDNGRAKSLFERAGFVRTGVDAGSGTLIYHFDLNGRAAKF